MFGGQFDLLLPNNEVRYKSILGMTLTLITFVTVTAYAVYRMGDIQEARSQINTVPELFYFNDTYRFDNNQGFKIGFTLVDNAYQEAKFDEKIGQLKVYKIISNDGNPNITNVQFKKCEKTDYTSEYSDTNITKFYPLHPSFDRHQDTLLKFLNCIPDDKLSVHGNSDSFKRESMAISFEQCTNLTVGGPVC